MNMVAVSSASGDAFSLMNVTAVDQRDALLVSNIPHLMTIKLIGNSIRDWDQTLFAES